MEPSVADARAAFARQDWRAGLAAFRSAATDSQLGAVDHERMAICAYLVGEDEESARAWEAAYRAALGEGDHPGAARCAFWLGLSLLLQGQPSRASGWLSRAGRQVAESGTDCAATGLLLIPELLHALGAGDPATAEDLATRAADLGGRFHDADLLALGVLGRGQALIAAGDASSGLASLDEVMVSVTSGEVGPVTSGIVYCAVILECMRLFDLQRAAEWTEALSSWCDGQPDLVPYRGQCLVHRSQLQRAKGAWTDAIVSAEAARRRLTEPPHPALGLATYQVAELQRLIGAFDDAESSYRLASRHGQNPMPGLAQLQLARGLSDAAVAGIRRALLDGEAPERPALLYEAVNILGSTGDVDGARLAADELSTFAAAVPSEVLGAMAAHAHGAVAVWHGDLAAGLAQLRTAAARWQALHMPYESARAAVLRGVACVGLGDATTAAVEFGNARQAFGELGAVPDLDRLAVLEGMSPGGVSTARTGDGRPVLSDREREVLAQVAAGGTNREVAARLLISEHTVGRHLENIFAKLGVSSRAAAIAFAYEHHLLGPATTRP